ncbi:hypothetical protein BJ912DRAFT_960055 [Pholiota molesta]|nr:hypothetical protein BJ912DRAFT_960055 [Pholiota molesta]
MASNRPPVSNNFGYDRRKSSPSQLRKVLQTENEDKVEEILLTIRRITSQELDLERVASIQEHQTGSVKRKIIQKYPDIFGSGVKESEKFLHHLNKYILYVHASHRAVRNKEKQREKIKNHMKESTKAKIPSASLNLRSSAVESSSRIEPTPSGNKDTSNLSKSTKENQENIAPSDRTPQASKSSRIPTTSSQASPPKEPAFSEESSSLLSQTQPPAFSQRSSAPVPSTHSPGDSGVPSHQHGATVRPIYEFLDACVPSMTHHLQSFLEFGCSTPEHLFSMSMWQPGMIHEVLDRLPPNVHGERLTEMEKLIIQNHILTYFKS